MKNKVVFLIIGLLLVSTVLFAQQGSSGQDFGRGGYVGNVLMPITIADLPAEAPNAYVIVSGYLISQRVPGTFVLADEAEDPTISVVVYFNDYDWANLQIDAATPVLIYGTVSKSDLRTEVIGERIEIPGGRE